MSEWDTGLNALGLQPGSTFVFQVVPHGDGTFDSLDTRTKTVVLNSATLAAAQADVITRNSALDAI